MTELSPQAQAVLDAITAVSPAPADEIATVALRAAADQVVPTQEPLGLATSGDECFAGVIRLAIRHQLLAIAAELDAHHG